MSGDNFHFDLTGVSLEKSLDIAFTERRKAIGWKVEKLESRGAGERLILFWSTHESMTPFAAPMDVEACIPFIKSWLEQTIYPSQPDHDGDNGKGWRVYNENWTHVAKLWQAFVAIEPVWIMYGK